MISSIHTMFQNMLKSSMHLRNSFGGWSEAPAKGVQEFVASSLFVSITERWDRQGLEDFHELIQNHLADILGSKGALVLFEFTT
jgi:hypothetical protein